MVGFIEWIEEGVVELLVIAMLMVLYVIAYYFLNLSLKDFFKLIIKQIKKVISWITFAKNK